MSIQKIIEKLQLPDSFHDIDEDDLAGEWVRQPGAYLRTAFKLAVAERAEAVAKSIMDECYATLSRAVRENPERFRLVKLSNEVVDNVVRTNKEYVAKIAAHIHAAYVAKLLKAACSAMEHKKKALENLVYLAGQGMHAAPRAKSDEDRQRITATDMRKRATKANNRNGKSARP